VVGLPVVSSLLHRRDGGGGIGDGWITHNCLIFLSNNVGGDCFFGFGSTKQTTKKAYVDLPVARESIGCMLHHIMLRVT
jgi:hypothetical protein